MNFLLRYCLGLGLLLLINPFVCTTIITSFGFLHVNAENATLFIMPVTSRSQARLSTGSPNESSIALSTDTRLLSTTRSTGIRVLSEAILQHHSPNTLSNTSIFQYLPSHIAPSSSTTSHKVDHCCCPYDSCSDTFQNSTFENFETTVQPVSNSPVRSSLVPFSSQFSIMEADCQDSTSDQKMSRETMDLTNILTMLSHQITNQNNAIQEHIMKNDMNFQRVVQENEDFKRTMRSELDDIRNLLACQNIWSQPNVSSGNTSSQAPLSPPVQTLQAAQGISSHVLPSSTGTSPSLVSSNLSGTDVQTLMLLMLSESFSKSSTALTDKKDDQKSEWHTFLETTRNFVSGTWQLWRNFLYLLGRNCMILSQTM
jgi:hypothetical protein